MGRGLHDLKGVKCVLVACPCSLSGPVSRRSLNREVSARAGRMYGLRHREQRALGVVQSRT